MDQGAIVFFNGAKDLVLPFAPASGPFDQRQTCERAGAGSIKHGVSDGKIDHHIVSAQVRSELRNASHAVTRSTDPPNLVAGTARSGGNQLAHRAVTD